MKKSDLLSSLEEKHQKWEAFLDEIGPGRMDQPGVNGAWSVKDIVAHLTGWNRRLVACLQAAQRGEPEPLPHWPAHLQAEDDINAWIYESNRRRSVRDVLDEMNQVHRQLLAVIDALPGATRFELIEPKYLVVWVGDTRFHVSEFFDHFDDDHEPDVSAWLTREENESENSKKPGV